MKPNDTRLTDRQEPPDEDVGSYRISAAEGVPRSIESLRSMLEEMGLDPDAIPFDVPDGTLLN
jgi:hypothetical protein